VLAKVMNYSNDKIQYSTVIYCYDKILVNVAAHVILQWIVYNIIKYNKNKIKYTKK